MGLLPSIVATIRIFTLFLAPLLPPPSYDDAMADDPPQRAAVTGLPQMREEEAREALLEFVAENCCYGRGAAEELKFTDLRHSSAFHVSTCEMHHEKTCLLFLVCHIPGCRITEEGKRLGISDLESRRILLYNNYEAKTNVLIGFMVTTELISTISCDTACMKHSSHFQQSFLK